MLSEVWNKITYSSVVELDKLFHPTIYMDKILIHAWIKVMTVHLLCMHHYTSMSYFHDNTTKMYFHMIIFALNMPAYYHQLYFGDIYSDFSTLVLSDRITAKHYFPSISLHTKERLWNCARIRLILLWMRFTLLKTYLLIQNNCILGWTFTEFCFQVFI